MDPKYTGEMLTHLEKQHEFLMDSYRSMSHELQKLQVEEEMLMRKFYELMAAQAVNGKVPFDWVAVAIKHFTPICLTMKEQKEDGTDVPDVSELLLSEQLVNVTSNEKQ